MKATPGADCDVISYLTSQREIVGLAGKSQMRCGHHLLHSGHKNHLRLDRNKRAVSILELLKATVQTCMLHAAEFGPESPSRWHIEEPPIFPTAPVPPSASQPWVKNLSKGALHEGDLFYLCSVALAIFTPIPSSWLDVVFRDYMAQFLKVRKTWGPLWPAKAALLG